MPFKHQKFAACTSAVAVCIALIGCGGGSGSSNSSSTSQTNPTLNLATPNGTTCAGVNQSDVFGTMAFETSQPINATQYGCLIVSANDKQPVFDGSRSARFEVRPNDCSASSAFNDCINDRSRHEINETGIGATEGQTITWEERLYIPSQPRFRPKGKNAMFLTQINYIDGSNYGTLAYLEVGQNNELIVRTHVGFTWDILKQYVIQQNPADKWVDLKFEVKSTAQQDGYLKVYVDGQLVVNETRQTIPSASSKNWLKLGIYNAFKSQATEPYDTQVVYFDGLSKSIR